MVSQGWQKQLFLDCLFIVFLECRDTHLHISKPVGKKIPLPQSPGPEEMISWGSFHWKHLLSCPKSPQDKINHSEDRH